MPDETIFYLHFPRLVLGPNSMAVLGGTLKTLAFETFQALDPDWARRSYYEQTQPAFWMREGSGGDADEVDDAMLVYNALLAVTAERYPDPRLSIRYHWSADGVGRRMGPYERTWLLGSAGLAPVGEEPLRHAALLAGEWRAHRLRHDHAVFSPLRGLSSLASTFIDPAAGILPLVASLEGYLAPQRTKGIAVRMGASLRALLGHVVPDDVEAFLRVVYRVRSSVIHGEEIPDEEAASVCAGLQRLATAAVIAAAERITREGFDPGDFGSLRKSWSVV